MLKVKKTLIFLLIKLWLKTIKVVQKFELNESLILALWHQDLIASMISFKDKNISVMISASADGDIATVIAEWLNYNVFRGSTSNQQTALRHLLRHLKNKDCKCNCVGMAIDGPKGPPKVIKEGSFWLQKNSESKTAFIKITYGKHFTLNTWDKAKIPFPFSKIYAELIINPNADSHKELSNWINQIS